MQFWAASTWAYQIFANLTKNLHILSKASSMGIDDFVGGSNVFWVCLDSPVSSSKQEHGA
jgi:hypothetical protein